MALADIQKKSTEERKREKRLVHATNALSREFLDSKTVKSKTPTYKETAEYLCKSLLDYVFFEEKKELRELNENHVRDFMLVYAPNKIALSTKAKEYLPEILTHFLVFLDEAGYIKNGEHLSATIKAEKRTFEKVIPAQTKTRKSKSPVARKQTSKRRQVKKPEIEEKVGRNDPCPCGSGKKFKKCCGQN